MYLTGSRKTPISIKPFLSRTVKKTLPVHDMTQQNDEQVLINQLQDEKTRRQAFEQIVRQYSQPLYWQIRRMVFSHEDANDVLQECFIKAWNNLAQFRGDSKLSTWLYRIVINETLNFIKRQKEHVSIDSSEANIINQLSSDPYFDGDETALQLQEAISKLPEKQRAVFTMKYYEEMKYEDMSRILDTSIGALKASYHHAVKKISDFFNATD